MKVLTAEIVGTLCGSGYPDKLTNQDALMGLYPAVRNVVHRERTDRPVKDEQDGRSAKLYARSASNFEGGAQRIWKL